MNIICYVLWWNLCVDSAIKFSNHSWIWMTICCCYCNNKWTLFFINFITMCSSGSNSNNTWNSTWYYGWCDILGIVEGSHEPMNHEGDTSSQNFCVVLCKQQEYNVCFVIIDIYNWWSIYVSIVLFGCSVYPCHYFIICFVFFTNIRWLMELNLYLQVVVVITYTTPEETINYVCRIDWVVVCCDYFHFIIIVFVCDYFIFLQWQVLHVAEIK